MKLAERSARAKQHADEMLKQIQPTPPQEPEPEEPAPEPALEPTPTPVIDWEHKFKTVDGMLKAANRQLSEKNTELEAIKRDLTALKAEQNKAKISQPVSVDFSSILSQEELEGYDETQLRVLKKIVDAAAVTATQKAQERFDAELEPVKQELEQTRATHQKKTVDDFFVRLAELQPDWSEINADSRFHDWLASENDDGVERQTILEKHHKEGNVVKVAKMFESFKKTLPKPRPTPSPVPEPIPAPTAAPTKNYITESEVAKFFNDKVRGKYRGRPKEAEQLEAKYNLAIREGRVIPG